MKIALYCFGGVAAFLALLAWLITQLRYRIGSRQLKIMLFGIPLRRISYEHITRVSKRTPKGLAEYWYNCFKYNHRLLSIERTRGLRKFICITPKNRYIFLADLKSAARRMNPECEWANNTGFDEASLTVTEDGHLMQNRPAEESQEQQKAPEV